MSALTKLLHSQIQGGAMPIEGVVQNQHQHLAAEVQKLTAENAELRLRVRELEAQEAWRKKLWQDVTVQERDGELGRTV